MYSLHWLKITNLIKTLNTDETDLFFHALPEHTLWWKNKSSGGCKKVKERLTMLLTCNMTGALKKTALLVGKSKTPCCFNGVKNLSVYYAYSYYNVVITLNMLKESLLEWDKELKRWENCSTFLQLFCTSGRRGVAFMFLPANATVIIQPLNKGIIRSFKFHYRKSIIQQIVKDTDSHNSSDSLTAMQIKSLSILYSRYTTHNKWDIPYIQLVFLNHKQNHFQFWIPFIQLAMHRTLFRPKQ